ncbi:15-hydroxyprostaglandin dehydrogenase [NAD(+)]-like isoform X2 [Mytilus californianus]|uniref:15-hydroxyprostaglandin dehydrogenase [NAD(+)]-like isoform X2 n=1 Tax=Mytilus californianus TaxID=6549 RepID=UPI0022481789|nr:15-hydroxyprostaglandin dehydrogenase [NAD(+)]-like isoform X2 [Mytilus californianus]
MKLKGKVALISGGARGLGRAYAEAILKASGKVCLCDIDSEEGLKTLKRFQTTFGNDNVMFVKCDVSDHDSFENVFKQAKRKFGVLDIVVNNAGLLTEDNVRKTMMVNSIGVIEGTQLATHYLSKQSGGQGGVVVNISSTGGLTPVFYMPIYVASKYSIVGYTRSVAQNPANKERGMRYTCLCPAFTDTTMFDKKWSDEGEEPPPGISEEEKKEFLHLIETTGVNTVEEVVKGFMKLLEVDDNNGAVMTVTKKHGVQYRHGKPLSHKL